MGRPKNEDIWKLYDEGPNKMAICKFCTKQYKFPNASRMSKHILKCFKCPLDTRQELKLKISRKTVERDPLRCITNMSTSNNSEETPNSSTSMVTTNSDDECTPVFQFHVVPEAQIHELNLKLAKAIYVSGAPLSIVEHPLWKDFFHHLQPSYKLPPRKCLSTILLDKVYKEMKQELMTELIVAKDLHLQCDGWSNLRNEGIINFLISKPEPALVHILNTECNRHTSDYISQEIIKIMKQYGEEKFFVIIGDNARNMQLAFQKVQIAYPHVVSLGCVAHALNLLSQDCLTCESLSNFIYIATGLIKTIKNSQVQSSLLAKLIKEKKCGQQLKLPAKTRWASNVAMLKSLQVTKPCLQALAVHESSTLPQDTKATLLEETFWIHVDQTLSILKPIAKWIYEIESNEHNIHKVCKIFAEIETAIVMSTVIGEDEKVNFLRKIQGRKEMCVKPIHFAANLLDPKTQGHELDVADEIKAMEFITEVGHKLNLNVISELADYKAKRGPLWGKQFIWESIESVDSISWWKGICSSSNLSTVAVRILSAPSTSAATERSFSTFSFIHNKQRNRLTTDRASKITYVAYNWNLRHRKIPSCINDDDNSEAEAIENEPRPGTSGVNDDDNSEAEEIENEPRPGTSRESESQVARPSLEAFSVDSESD